MGTVLERERLAAARLLENDGVQPDAERLDHVRAEVFALIPGYHQAKARSDDGRQFSITRHTKGIVFDDLREGQFLMLTVTRHLPRVLRAQVIA